MAQNYNYLRSLPLASQRSELCSDWMLNVGIFFAFSQSMSLSDIAEIAQFTSFQYLSNKNLSRKNGMQKYLGFLTEFREAIQ